jgi:poly-beta-1,6-N-acetyl-D-glucosamine synthase
MITAAILLLAGLFVYPFLLYPAILRVLTLRKTQRNSSPVERTDYPTLALLICALNEERIIGEKMENSLALEYPKDRLRILVVSDGSTDRTSEIVREYEQAGITLTERKERRGKIANLNEVIPTLEQEIVVLSDANVLYRSDALLRLVERFSDPSVGCVSGKVILKDTTEALDGSTKDYYSLEWFLQEQASILYSMVGADGAMYAFHRELFRPCPNDTIIEDFVIPMAIIGQGRRVVLQPTALAWEKGSVSLHEEYRRKVRIAAGAMQALIRGDGWPRNGDPRLWLIFISHKLLRWMSPVCGLGAILLALMTPREPVSIAILAGSAGLAGLAGLRLASGSNNPLLSNAFYFLFGEVALAVGLVKGLAGKQTVLWAKADR